MTSAEGATVSKPMWLLYDVVLTTTTPFANGLPESFEEIKAMMKARAATDAELKRKKAAGETITPIDELAEEVAEEAGVLEEPAKGRAAFLHDDEGLYYEGRCVKAHLKDCANQVREFLGITALKAKVANKVYVETERIYLGKTAPDGSETRIIHAWTPQGQKISSFKEIDYVENATLKFQLRVLNDGVITKGILDEIFRYGALHGIGQERSQGWGRYMVFIFKLAE